MPDAHNTLLDCALQEDVPFVPGPGSPLWERAHGSSNGTVESSSSVTLLPEDAGLVDLKEFDDYISTVYSYLQGRGSTRLCVLLAVCPNCCGVFAGAQCCKMDIAVMQACYPHLPPYAGPGEQAVQ
eukprot:scaffold272611_cov21-Tisochrysis_lutea.AAC.1